MGMSRYVGVAVFVLGMLAAAPSSSLADMSMQLIQDRVNDAGSAATITIPGGVYIGNLVISRSVVLVGQGDVVFDGGGQGDVVRVRAPDVTLQGLLIRNSGKNLTAMNAGVFVERSAERVRIVNNSFDNVAFGIWLDGCRGPVIADNRIHGAPQLRSQDRGNGVHLYDVHDGLVRNNEIWETRDGIYIDTSRNNRLDGNFLHDLRFGVHYMYAYNNEVTNNHTLNTRTGYALMQSKNLTVTGNVSDHDRNYGILMNYIVGSEVSGNHVLKTRSGRTFVTGGEDVAGAEGKGLFIYNSQYNEVHDNTLEDADIGIHLTAGSEDNRVYGNAFIRNKVQVKYVATREQEWSLNGKGNYWSDYLGWDVNNDGIGDRPYEPNDAVDKLLWRYPVARILMSSPAIETLRWVQQQFPVFKPQGVRDSFPLMYIPDGRGVMSP